MLKICQCCKKEYTAKPSNNKYFCDRICSSMSRVGVKRPEHSKFMRNPKNWSIKSRGGMEALHVWLHRRIPKTELCEICHKVKPIDLANISQEYKQELTDWMWLCRSCHIRQDGRLYKLAQYMGIDNSGVNNGSAKITTKEVREIYLLKEKGLSYSDIARKFSMSSWHISKICRGISWSKYYKDFMSMRSK